MPLKAVHEQRIPSKLPPKNNAHTSCEGKKMPSATTQARKILINLIEYVKSIDLPFELFSQIIHTCFLRHALV